MRSNQTVQAFVNYFASLLQNVSWANEPNAVFSRFQLKLTKPILFLGGRVGRSPGGTAVVHPPSKAACSSWSMSVPR
jgi:hypothetical protein